MSFLFDLEIHILGGRPLGQTVHVSRGKGLQTTINLGNYSVPGDITAEHRAKRKEKKIAKGMYVQGGECQPTHCCTFLPRVSWRRVEGTAPRLQ